MTPRKALFDVISLLGDLVIAYRTNFVVVVPKAFRAFHDQCPVQFRVLAMFTGTFRVKGGGRFRATTLCFLTVVFVSLSLSWESSWRPSSEATFFSSSSSPSSSKSDELSSLLLSFSEVFSAFLDFSFSIKLLSKFLFLLKPLSIPNSAGPSRNVFSARGLVTSLLRGSKTYYTTIGDKMSWDTSP